MFVCLLHISSLGFAVVYSALACTPCSGFFRGFVAAFLAFFTVVFNSTFHCRFSEFQWFQYYMLYICIIPTWYISTSGSCITCTYTEFVLIINLLKQFLDGMKYSFISYIKQIHLAFNPLKISSYTLMLDHIHGSKKTYCQ